MQNKLHWAITGQTAAELIYTSADANQIFMGLTTWKGGPHGKILTDEGKVSALEAKLKAESEYEVYRQRQDADFVSDFDRVVEETKRIEGSASPRPAGAGNAKKRGAPTADKPPSKGRRKP